MSRGHETSNQGNFGHGETGFSARKLAGTSTDRRVQPLINERRKSKPGLFVGLAAAAGTVFLMGIVPKAEAGRDHSHDADRLLIPAAVATAGIAGCAYGRATAEPPTLVLPRTAIGEAQNLGYLPREQAATVSQTGTMPDLPIPKGASGVAVEHDLHENYTHVKNTDGNVVKTRKIEETYKETPIK